MGCKEKKTLPRHVAIIMDGNGRWAKERGLPRLKGHEEGANSVMDIIRACRDIGIEYLTLYAFSVENWVRSPVEVNGLMRLLMKFLKEQEQELHDGKVRLRVIGRFNDLASGVRKELKRVIDSTVDYDKGNLTLALSYGGRTEIVNAIRKIAKKVDAGEISADSIDEKIVSENMYAPDVPDPDLLIRTSGEMRISNFLLWQISYAELYFTDVKWPDFRREHFEKALQSYACRNRRYGNAKQ